MAIWTRTAKRLMMCIVDGIANQNEKQEKTRLTYNCAHLRSTTESLTIEYFRVKTFLVKIFWVKIFGVKILWVKIFWVTVFWDEIFLGENCFG